jgi:hypothetical protein
MDNKTNVRQGRLALIVLKLSKVSARSTIMALRDVSSRLAAAGSSSTMERFIRPLW